MATDVFGDSSLFDEFEKDRLPQGSYIKSDTSPEDTSGKDKHIVFSLNDFESESSNDAGSDSEQQQQHHSKTSSRENESVSNGSHENPSKESTTKENQNEKLYSKSKSFTSSLSSSTSEMEVESATVSKLNCDLEKLKRFTKILDTSRHVPTEEGPAVQVLFQNNSIARKYRSQIEQYISMLMQQERENGCQVKKINLKADALSTVDLNPDFANDENMDMGCWSTHAIIGCSQMYDGFMLDTLGWPLVQHTPALTEGWVLPTYEPVYENAMPCDDSDTDTGPKKRQRPKACCFNCGESHMLSECPEPKDQARIRQNRREFREINGSPGSLSKGLSQARYHIEDDPRFTGFKPGVISADLREALGLEDHQVPAYIYKMRVLGYPPGWRSEIEDQKSGISLFDKHGNEVTMTGESLEDGEMKQEDNEATLNASKIIEYEGFTVPLTAGKEDEHHHFRLPPLQPHHLKGVLEAQIKVQQEAAKKMKRRRPVSTDEDMDLDSDYGATPAKKLSHSFMSPPPLPVDTPPCNPPLPDGTPPPTPPVALGRALSFGSGTRRSVDGGSSEPGTPSESLEDLENQYRVLVQQLAAEDGTESDLMVVDSYDSSKEGEKDGGAGQGEISQADSENTQELKVEEEMADPNKLPESNMGIFKPSVSLSKDYGTPILQETAISHLPDSSKFGRDIEDHIPFENLPDSTGTFEKLKGLLGKIRDKVGDLRKKKSKS